MSPLLLFSCLPCVLGLGGDLLSHENRNGWLKWYRKNKDGEPTPTLVVAAQGAMEGPLVATSVFKSGGNFPALTGIGIAVGLIKLGNDNNGGCAVVPFHNHPNCFEVMTTLDGYGAYGQIRPDGSVQHSRILHAGDTWIMEQGSNHYYRNLNPNGVWANQARWQRSAFQ